MVHAPRVSLFRSFVFHPLHGNRINVNGENIQSSLTLSVLSLPPLSTTHSFIQGSNSPHHHTSHLRFDIAYERYPLTLDYLHQPVFAPVDQLYLTRMIHLQDLYRSIFLVILFSLTLFIILFTLALTYLSTR